MRTAIDANVISSLWSSEESAARLLDQLGDALSWGSLAICPVVYAELHAYPEMSRRKLEEFLDATRIVIDWQLDHEVWALAGARFAEYGKRRRKQKHGDPKRMLADFVIGAHAHLQADRLLTLDQRRFRHDFPELILF